MFQDSERVPLRNHPAMSFRGRRNWPPEWFPTPGASDDTLTGEIGTLEEVFRPVLDESRCYLTIRHKGQAYIGVLQFDNIQFCKEISDLLGQNNGRAIDEIGSMTVGPSAEFDSGDR